MIMLIIAIVLGRLWFGSKDEDVGTTTPAAGMDA